jgi:1-acyl-sn-glycerol-3-phosphate acyltransferase
MSLLVTEMVFRIPLLGGYMERAGHIRVDEGAGRAAFDRAVAKLRAGKTVGIFPEGALSPREGGMCPARTGTARMALIAAVPVIPVGIWLDRSLIRRQETQVDHMEATARYYLRGPYAITVGEPLTFTGNVEDREAVRAMSSAINDRIQRLTIESARRLYERRRVEAHDLISAAQGMQI